jgi:uncharacterized membrane protein
MMTTWLTWPYIHLLINHFPVVLATAGFGAVILAMIFRRRGLWLYAMGTLAAAGATVYPVRFSGDQADIDAHDAASLWALICLLLAGMVSAYGLWRALKRPQEEIPGWLRAAVFIGALLGFSTVARTAYLGGKIIHEAPILRLPQPPGNLPPGIATVPDSAPGNQH